MSQPAQLKTADSLDPLSSSPLKVLALPNIPRSNARKATVVEKKVLEEANHDDIEFEINNTELAQDYFREDPEQQPEDNIETMKKKYQNGMLTNVYESYFKPKVFFKFLLMHALFYCLLGPFIIILTPIFGWHVLYNQGFVGCQQYVFRQSAEFMFIIAFLFVYYMTNMIGMQAIEVYMMFAAVMLRIMTISSKYSYQSENFLKMMHTTKLSRREQTNDNILGRWRIQNDEVIQEEIQAAIMRLEVDSPLFFFNFLGQTSAELKAKLMKVSKICREASMAKKNPDGEEEAMPCMKSMDTMRERNMDKTFSWAVAPKSQREIGSEQVSFSDTPKERASFAETPKVSYADTPKEKASLAETPKEKVVEQPKSLLKTSLTKQLPASGTAAVFKAFSHFFDEKQLERKFLYGYNLVFDLIKTARARRFHHLGKKILLISIFRALIPTFYRVYLICYKKDDIPLFTDKPYIVVIIFFLNMYFFWVNTFTLAQSVQAFRSKIWCFKQIGYMISPKKIHYFKEKKVYPTFNIFDPITLKTWSSLRKVCKEYGKKYFLRNNLNIAIAMVFYTFMFLTLILQAFGVFTSYGDPLMFLVFGFETLISFIIFANVMMGAAFLNSQYGVHKNLLKKNKTIISDFQRLSYLYVGRDAIKPDNIIYKEGLRILRSELGEENFREKLVERAGMLTGMIDDIIEELNFEENNEPFMVMGIAVNYTLLKSLALGGVSLAFALGQSLANG